MDSEPKNIFSFENYKKIVTNIYEKTNELKKLEENIKNECISIKNKFK